MPALYLQKTSLNVSMLSRVLLYMDRLLARHPKPDHEILETIHWLLGSEIVEEDLLPLVSMFSGAVISRRFESEIEEEIHDPRDFAYVMDQVLRKSRRSEQFAIIDLLRDLLNKRMDQLQYSGTSDIEKNLNTLQEMFDLSELEKEICLFLFVLSIYERGPEPFSIPSPMRPFFRQELSSNHSGF